MASVVGINPYLPVKSFILVTGSTHGAWAVFKNLKGLFIFCAQVFGCYHLFQDGVIDSYTLSFLSLPPWCGSDMRVRHGLGGLAAPIILSRRVEMGFCHSPGHGVDFSVGRGTRHRPNNQLSARDLLSLCRLIKQKICGLKLVVDDLKISTEALYRENPSVD